MKKQVLVLLGFLLGLSLFAQCGEPPFPPVTNFLIPDRIRNTIAVDPDVSGEGIRFYATTFGLENFDGTQNHMEKAPLPKPASLVRFGIGNTKPDPPYPPWTFTEIIINTMDEPVFNEPGSTPINCYADNERNELQVEYPALLTFTDNSTGREGLMRYLSGTGCWASPVLYKDNLDNNHLIILNKSGCLMSVKVTDSELTMEWKINLRDAERTNDNHSFAYEFIATPVLVDGKIYVAGIKLIHVIDISTAFPTKSEYTLPNILTDDYLDTPVVFDTQPSPNRSFYIISHKGKPYQLKVHNIYQLSVPPLGLSGTQPFLDSDGHVYFATSGTSSPVLSYIEQEERNPNLSSAPLVSVDIPLISLTERIHSSVLSDFTRNQYLLTSNNVLRINEPYNFSTYSPNVDPVNYISANPNDWCSTTSLSSFGKRFPSNNAILSYHNSTIQTMLFTFNNGNSDMYGTEVAEYYPSNTAEYDISLRSVDLSYVGYNHSYQVPSVQVSLPVVCPDLQSWGGIAPYHSSISGYLNALFGDECGSITTYKTYLPSASVNFDPAFEIGEDVIPEMGYAKYLKNLNNVPTHDEINLFKVFIYGLDITEESCTFLNAHVAANVEDHIPESTIEAASATFNKMLPNKRYRITWKDNNNEVVFCDNIVIDDNSSFVIINADPDMVVENTPNDPDTETTWVYPQPLHFNSITLLDNAHWRIGNNSNISVSRLILGSGSKVTIGDGAVLNVIEAVCSSPNSTAVFNVDGQHTGRLIVSSNLENTNDSSLLFKGYNMQTPSYVLNTVINKPNAILELVSMNTIVTSDLISTSIGSLQNKGRVDVNDCAEVTRSFFDDLVDSIGQTIRGTLKINNGTGFGNLVWRIADGSIKSHFYIGDAALTQPQRAKLTIKDAICTFIGHGTAAHTYNAFGNIVVKGTAACIVNDSATLCFKTGAKLDLVGNLNPDLDGAEVIANYTSGLPGIIQFEEGVSISGMKPNPAPNNPRRFGDRIRTDEYGSIVGSDINLPRKLSNIHISSTHPNQLRWDGILVNTEYETDEHFMLYNSSVIGIEKIYVKYSNAPEYFNNSYGNCTYGIYFDGSNNSYIEQTATIRQCSFASNHCGIFVQDNQFSNGTLYLKAEIKDECTFGGDTNEEQNEYGISLINCKEAIVQGCTFNNNIFGIYAQDSSILVGGKFDEETYIPVGSAMDRNNFYYNDHAAIWIDHTSSKSLIYNNVFTEQDEPNGRYSGMGIYANDAELNVMNNHITNLRGHGFLGTKTHRTPPNPQAYYHGFSNNWFQNNGGCELIGDGASLSSIKMLINDPNNRIIDQQGSTVNEPSSLFDFENWDHYLLANLTPEDIAEVYNNTYNPNWVAAPDRFYPDVSAFLFVPEPPEPPTSPQSLMNMGTDYFFQGEFSLAQDIMKQIVDAFPDSMITASTINYLYLIERATENDYASLREYLDLKIPFENMAPYLEKEAVKTQCYLKEEDYLSTIQRLQLVINNPISVADSLFALIDQSYCLYKYASEGSKALPNCSATTTSIKSYMDFLTKLGKPQLSPFQEFTPPSRLLIQSNYPNPFNPSTTINYAVPYDGLVKLVVYNLRGQKVKELISGKHLAGNHKIIWTGTDASGRSVSSGIYFIRIEQGGKSHVRKMMLLK